MKIIFDLDGTLVNSQRRLYNLFTELTETNEFSYERYWSIKRERITQRDFLIKYFDYSEDQLAAFRGRWRQTVEEEERVLSEDFPVEGIQSVIASLSKNNELYIVTNRQKTDLAAKEVDFLFGKCYFEKVLATEQKVSKIDLIRRNISFGKGDCLVGDTGEDVKTAQKLGIHSVAVSWGVLSEKILSGYKPDFLVGDIAELLESLSKLEVRL